MGNTRELILNSALREFSRNGVAGTSLRSIAVGAGVDPALVWRTFRSKEGLFLELVAQRMEKVLEALPPEEPLRADVGESIVRTFLHLWDGEENRKLFAAIFRTAVLSLEFAEMLRDQVLSSVLARMRDAEDPQADRRVGLSMTQLVGLGLARYVVRTEPVASMPVEDLVALAGPTLTRYLREPLPGPSQLTG